MHLIPLPEELRAQLPVVLASLNLPATLNEQQTAQLQRVLIGSHYAHKQLQHNPDWLQQLLTDPMSQVQPLALLDDETAAAKALRNYRNHQMVGIIWRDLNRLVSPQATCYALSHLADTCIQAAVDFLYPRLCETFGQPLDKQGNPQGLFVIGMGKLGSRELNLSSDIDLIFAYPAAGQTQGSKSISHSEFFANLGQRLIKLLDANTPDGFVFRVDMRLRPFGQSGVLACSFEALEDYYHNHGREWERFAMIKARVCAHNGEAAQAEQLTAILRRFTYRKYTDFSVIQALRNLKLMISREVNKKGKEDDVKLGAGGIREIEFIAQAFQLLRGGRELPLQARSLIPVFQYLSEKGALPAGVADKLISAYWFLRNTEHALQALDDRQTQALPSSSLEQARLAWVMGFKSWDAFHAELQQYRQWVSTEFAAVVAAPNENDDGHGDPLAAYQSLWLGLLSNDDNLHTQLAAWGFSPEAEALSALRSLRQSPKILAMHAQSRERLDIFTPKLLRRLKHAQNPLQALTRLIPFIEAVARRSAYLLLLIENPQALDQLVKLCDASSWIAERLTKHPALLDELINPASLYQIPTQVELAQELRQHMLRIEINDLEAQMEALRYFRWAQALKIAACEVTGALPLMRVSDCLTYLAEVIVDYAFNLAKDDMLAKHGSPAGAANLPFIIVAYGKLGGLELAHGSDLDLVFLHQSDPNSLTDGAKPLEASVFYPRLAQKMIHILSTKTASGELYEVDVRLRPSGNSGPLVTSLNAFEKYQRESAWTWEHQALVRARPVAGDASVAQAFVQLRLDLLCQERNLPKLKEEVRSMREKMRTQLGSKKSDQAAGLFNLKQDAGGIVDIEFMVQYLALAWAHADSSLVRYTDNIRILGSLETTGRLEAHQAHQLINAYKEYRTLGHKLALQQAPTITQRAPLAESIAQVSALWQQVIGER
jgi:[glutamine synthetase] adenylyltransferase / [glutamine synthetase]-adenylyl-L-tyrosine phosphorylase